ncbi:MAG: DMT family transporter [Methanomassiliicoccales archaeon]|nr:MAG: DMT family transporter [Methanomassiliicoccales archaeon]
MVALFAIGAAFFFGFSDFLIRVGLRYSNARSAVLFSMVSGLLAPLIISLFTVPLKLFANSAAVYFILSGLIGPFIARYLLYVGIERVGVSIAIPLANMRPLFGAIIAVVILGEELTLSIAGATLLIMTGAGAISSERSGGQIERQWSRRDLIFPILASFFYGLAYVIRKLGMNTLPEPLVAVVLQNAAALLFLLLIAPVPGQRQSMDWRNTRAWLIFSMAGLAAFIAHYCIFYALDLGQVVIIAPLVALNPFFSLLLTGVFLRMVERVTWKIVLGSIFIVGGTVVLTMLS